MFLVQKDNKKSALIRVNPQQKSQKKTPMATLSQHSIHHIHRTASGSSMPHGLGLLTTVASLPPKYRSRYLSIKTKCEIPLDLSVKQLSPQIANDVPIATSFTEVYTEPSPHEATSTSIVQEMQQTAAETITTTATATLTEILGTTATDAAQNHRPTAIIIVADAIDAEPTHHHHHQSITPPLTPTKRKYLEHCAVETSTNVADEEHHIFAVANESLANPTKLSKTDVHPTTKREVTPSKPIRSTDTAPKTTKSQPPSGKPVKNKATRKLKFDEETSSPVSGTIIRPLEDVTDGSVQYSNGDIDPKYNIVEITEETKAELAAIKNVIGDYICKLCRIKFDDAFGLARHRCACIVLLEYRCPECGKQFNCPANLASHRRWHKPKKEGGGAQQKKENRNTINTTATTTTTKATTTITTATTTTLRNVKTLPEKSTENLTYACVDCGKKFKRQAYLRKHQLTHAVTKNTKILPQQMSSVAAAVAVNGDGISSRMTTNTMTTHAIGSRATSYQSYAKSTTSSASSSSNSTSSTSSSYLHSNSHSHSSASSLHSYNGAHEDESVVAAYTAGGIASGGYDFADDADSLSDDDDECSNSSTGYGRLQIVESGLTEEENIAAAALTNLRNCASVIQHTTLAH